MSQSSLNKRKWEGEDSQLQLQYKIDELRSAHTAQWNEFHRMKNEMLDIAQQKEIEQSKRIEKLEQAIKARDEEWLDCVKRIFDQAHGGEELSQEDIIPIMEAIDLDREDFLTNIDTDEWTTRVDVQLNIIDDFCGKRDEVYKKIPSVSDTIHTTLNIKPDAHSDHLEFLLYIQNKIINGDDFPIDAHVPFIYSYLEKDLMDYLPAEEQGLQILMLVSLMTNMYNTSPAVPIAPSAKILNLYKSLVTTNGLLHAAVARYIRVVDLIFRWHEWPDQKTHLGRALEDLDRFAPPDKSPLIPWLFEEWSRPKRETWMGDVDMASSDNPDRQEKLIIFSTDRPTTLFPDELFFIQQYGPEPKVLLYRGKPKIKGYYDVTRKVTYLLEFEEPVRQFTMNDGVYRYWCKHHGGELERIANGLWEELFALPEEVPAWNGTCDE